MIITRTFQTIEDRSEFLIDRFGGIKPLRPVKFGGSKEENKKVRETFVLHELDQWGYFATFDSETIDGKDNQLIELLKSLTPNFVRDGIVCYEGSSNEIAQMIKAPSNKVLSTLRELRDTGNDWVKYSRTSGISPTVKAGGIYYWRIELSQPKSKKVTFNKK